MTRYRQLPLPSTKQNHHHHRNMAAPRLTFLYPNFFRSIRSCEPHASRPLRDAPHHRTAQKAGFHSTARKRQETYAQRYGPASDLPPPHLGDAKVTTSKDITKDPKPSAPIKAEKKTEPAEPKPEVKKTEKEAKREANATSDGRSSPKDITKRPAELDAGESHPKELAHDGPPREGASKPLETVLYIEPATSTNSEEHRPPHLHAPPYVHHFDTYTLVKDLEKGGFTQDQSVTLMKAVRSLLALNLDVAKEGLVSKSDVENVRPMPSPNLLPLLPQSLTARQKNRKPTSSAPPVPNSAPKSKTTANRPRTNSAPSAPNSSTKSTSSTKNSPRNSSRSKTISRACSTTVRWPCAWNSARWRVPSRS